MTSVLSSIGNLEKYTFTRYVVKVLLYVVCAFTLALPIFFRDKLSLLYGFEAYFHISSGPVSHVLSLLSSIFNVDVFLVAKLVPVVLGVLAVIIFYEILVKLGFRQWIVLLASLLLVFSPSFMFLFATLTDFAFVAVLMLSIFYFLLLDKKFLAIVLFYIISFFGVYNLMLAFLLLLFYFLSVREWKVSLYSLPSLALLPFSSAQNLFSFGSFISDFGGIFGLGVFIIILSAFGLKFFWKDKYTHFYFYLSIILFIVFSFFNLRFLAYLNFILVLLAALGLQILFERHWKSKPIKYLTMMILLIGLILTGFSYMTSIVNGLPNKETVDAIYGLRDLPGDIVVAHPSREYWIGFAGKHFVSAPDLFYTRDIGNATAIINSKWVSYIWVDKDMQSMVWVEEDEGLLFLLKYSKSFKEVYSNDYVKIWEFERGVVE
jgi:hypothetical protein